MKLVQLALLFLSVFSWAQTKLLSLSFEELKRFTGHQNDTTYVVNFWATWCKPCVKELPHFYQAAEELENQKVRFAFVSLDFPKNHSKVQQFLTEKSAPGFQFLLTEKDPNTWVEKVDKDWQGNIPATWILNNQKTVAFRPEELNLEELQQLIFQTSNK